MVEDIAGTRRILWSGELSPMCKVQEEIPKLVCSRNVVQHWRMRAFCTIFSHRLHSKIISTRAVKLQVDMCRPSNTDKSGDFNAIIVCCLLHASA